MPKKRGDPNLLIIGAMLFLAMRACAWSATAGPGELTTHSDGVVLSVRVAD